MKTLISGGSFLARRIENPRYGRLQICAATGTRSAELPLGQFQRLCQSAERELGAPVHGNRRAELPISFPARLRAFLIIAATLLFAFNHAFATDVSAGFDAANKLYEQGKFAEAASSYENLVRSNTVSSALYFNLGNARFKAGEVGKAIAAYRIAEDLSPRDPDLQANLQFVRNQIHGPNAQPTRWERWFGRLTINEWAIVGTLPLWIFLLLLTAIQLRPALKLTLRGWIWSSGIATVVCSALLVVAWQIHSAPKVIVTAREAVVRNGPLEESQNAFTVHDGAELKFVDQKNDWVQVSVGDRVGWLKREQVTVD